MNLSLQQPNVRDLWWAINGPRLFKAPELCQWFDSSDWFIDLLQQLDHQPASLIQHLQQSQTAPYPTRLGQYFELLWHFYFKQHPHYQLLEHNLQIKSPDNRTLGELDLLIRHQQSHKVIHLELAVKFYLAVAQQPADINLACYIGPGLKDRLLHKYMHTCNHQLPLSTSEVARARLAEKHLQVDQAKAVFRGRLFHPLSIAEEGQHAWLAQTQLDLLNPHAKFLCLERQQWFATLPENHNSYCLNQLSHHLASPLTHPQQVAVIDPHTRQEIRRLFVVPDGWEAAARACLDQPF